MQTLYAFVISSVNLDSTQSVKRTPFWKNRALSKKQRDIRHDLSTPGAELIGELAHEQADTISNTLPEAAEPSAIKSPEASPFEKKLIHFRAEYRRMNDADTWHLQTGKVVEDQLYNFGHECRCEHPCHSWIVDPSDYSYIESGTFTPRPDEIATIYDKTHASSTG
ncbi:hypothetical protein VTP01DRAFT_5921 [Rhizomucor pusillus]|uniref:uncharacterized protein n=1 Tax=Rhizomucor pusillus TaxID=4840 RepID=UPI0037446554